MKSKNQPNMIQLSLTIGGKQYPPYSFSLDNGPVIFDLGGQLESTDPVMASLSGNYIEGTDPFYELKAGFEPDVVFCSHDISQGKGDLYSDGKDENGRRKDKLFQQVYGRSCLLLTYWDDYGANYDKSRVVLIINVVGTVPEDKQIRLEQLTRFFQDEANGYFLRDRFHGNTKKEFDLIYRSGYSSYQDPVIELECIQALLNDKFCHHLRGVIRRPIESFHSVFSIQSAGRVRRLSLRNWKRVESQGTDMVPIWEQKRIPSLHSPCNNVISTFLQKLQFRLFVIRSDLEQKHTHYSSEYVNAQNNAKWRAGAWNGTQYSYEVSQMETERDALNEHLALCGTLLSLLGAFLSHHIFKYSSKRRQFIFDVPASEFRQTEHYRRLYDAIKRFELTHFYWIGDHRGRSVLPSFQASASGQDFWIRKYSMLYEYWCYLRMHQTFFDLGFSPEGEPGTNIMQRSVYTKNDLRISLFHEVRAGQKYRGAAELFPKPFGTPDFAIVFENLKTNNTALVVLDAKADACVRTHIILSRNKYLRSTLGRKKGKDRFPPTKMIQSWIILSGEDEPQKRQIECPPIGLKSQGSQEGLVALVPKDELSVDDKDCVSFLAWDAVSSLFSLTPPNNPDDCPDEFLGMGYLRSRIRCCGDSAETDQFKTFLTAEIKLMDQLLAQQEDLDETEH